MGSCIQLCKLVSDVRQCNLFSSFGLIGNGALLLLLPSLLAGAVAAAALTEVCLLLTADLLVFA